MPAQWVLIDPPAVELTGEATIPFRPYGEGMAVSGGGSTKEAPTAGE
jgi:hypothetical protein